MSPDTDNLTHETKIEIETDDLNEDFDKDLTKFDFSNYWIDWKFYE